MIIGNVLSPFSIKNLENYVWDDDALAYISNISDMRQQGKVAVNNLVLAHKNNNLWTKLKHAIICPDTLSETQALRELKNNTVYSSSINYGAEQVVTNTPAGYSFQVDTSLANHIDVSRTFTQMGVTTTSCAIVHCDKRDYTGATAYGYGAIQSTTQRALFLTKNLSNNFSGQMFAQSNAVSAANTDARGIYILNRNANNYLELAKDGTVLDTDTGIVASTLPTVTPFVGAYNAGGGPVSPSSGIKPFFAVYTGLTTGERAILNTIWSNYNTDMGRGSAYTKSIVMDGNSLTVRGAHRMFRKALYSLPMNNYNTHNIGVAGQTLDDVMTRYPTYGAPLYDATLTDNIYILLEIGNQLRTTAVADVKTKAIDAIALAAATGYTTVIVVPDARLNTSAKNDTDWYLEMDEMVQWVRAGNSGADYIVDVASSNLWLDRSSYGSDAAYVSAIQTLVANTTYYTDGVHKTEAGYDLRGTDLYNVLNSIL